MNKGKIHTTHYIDTLISPSADSRVIAGKVPEKAQSIAGLQYRMLADAPYRLTGDDVLVAVTATRRDIPEDEWSALRDELFSKGQPCLRTSPLVKSHGWGLHYDADGRIVLVGCETARFHALREDPQIAQVSGMRSKRV